MKFNKQIITKIIMIFLMIQPLLDIYFLYNISIVGQTIPTIIRLLFFFVLLFIFIFNNKISKGIYIYFSLILVYSIFHVYNIYNFKVELLGNVSIISEITYMIRLIIPIIFIYMNNKVIMNFDKVSKIVFAIAAIISIIIIGTNVLDMALPSYPYITDVKYNIFGWPFLDKNVIKYSDLATKGLFHFTNPLAGVMSLLLPILICSYYKQFNKKKFVILLCFLISMLMLGTRTSSYFSIILLLLLSVIYLFLVFILKKEKFSKNVFTYSALLIILFGFIFINAPITFKNDRYLLPESVDYNKNNDLLGQEQKYLEILKDGNLTKEQLEALDKFVMENYMYFSINKTYIENLYPYQNNRLFWLEYMPIAYQNNYGNREFEFYFFDYIKTINNNKLDTFFGFGYTKTADTGIILEKDFVSQYYTMGVLGIILFLSPYLIILIICTFKILKDYEKKMSWENICLICSICVGFCSAYLGGNLLDNFMFSILLSFICSFTLTNVLKKDESGNQTNKHSDIKISVIVPVYNVEKYLDKCLKSLVSQTLKDIEIIVINDGSPDNSQKIIDKYVKKYSNLVKSFIKKNGGLSSARNYGLRKANGQYIAFIDSDDYVSADMCEKLYNKAIQKYYDIVVCDMIYYYENGKNSKVVDSNYPNDLNTKEEVKDTMVDFYPSVCNKIYKKEILEGLSFKEKVMFEDVEYMYRLYSKVNSIGTVKEPLYYYLQREGSITHIFDDRVYFYIDNWNGIIDYYKNNNLYDEYKKELEYCYVRYIYATFIKISANLDRRDFDKAVNVAIKNVTMNFPGYRKNKYFYRSLKGIYLLLFNKKIANILYKKVHK